MARQQSNSKVVRRNAPRRTRPPRFERVLVAVDFSRASSRALTRAMSLPLLETATLRVLHVLPRALPPPLDREGEAVAHQRIAGAAALRRRRMPGLDGLTVESDVIRGDSPDAIVRRARHAGSELIVLGRSGLLTGARSGLGSTARSVARRGSIPVLVVGSRGGRGYRRPLVALTPEHESGDALRLAERLAPAARAIGVAHACDVPYDALFRRAGLDLDLARHRREVLARARREVTGYLRTVRRLTTPLRVTVECGSARDVVLESARTHGADLIALGANGRRSGVGRLLLGSVAEDVLRRARCDVVVTRPE